MKICPKCGKQCEDNYIFCDSCGYTFEPESDITGKAATNQTQAAAGNSFSDFENTYTDRTQSSHYGTQNQAAYYNGQANNNQHSGGYENFQGSRQDVPPHMNTYQQNPAPNYCTAMQKTNPFAIASFVLGLIGIIFLCVYLSGTICAILAIIFGFMARSRIANSAGTEKGDGLAVAGIVLGIITVCFAVIVVICALVFGFAALSFLGENSFNNL